MNVTFKFLLSGNEISITEDCKDDREAFKFMQRMQELYGNTICKKSNTESDKVFINVRKATDEKGKEYDYYEMICKDPNVLSCNYCKREFGTYDDKSGNLFPKNKDSEGKWNPWRKYNKETGKEE